MSKENTPAIKFNYLDLRGYEFSNAMAKIANSPTVNHRATHIRDVLRKFNEAVEKIGEEYKKEIRDAFGIKDEKGKVIDTDEGYGFKAQEGKDEDIKTAVAEFGKREITLDCRPLTPDTLSDIKLTAKELDLLGDLFTTEAGPGLPRIGMQR